MLHGRRDGILGDGVEDDPFDLNVLLEGAALLQRFHKVPGNGFPFAIRVGREDQRVGIFQRIGDVGDPLGGLGVSSQTISKSLSGSTEPFFEGRSRICPYEPGPYSPCRGIC